MKKIAYLTAALFGLAALGQAGAYAGLVNAGFETGDLTGWTTKGALAFDPGVWGPLASVGSWGSIYSGAYAATIATGLGAYSPTTLSQTIFLNAGETISGAADFITEDHLRFNDWSSITIDGVTLFYADVAHAGAYDTSGWLPYSFTAPSPGWYTLTASVTNDIDNGGLSLLRLDAVVPEPSAVPEPSTWAMLLIGFACLGFAGYRASRKNVAPAVTFS